MSFIPENDMEFDNPELIMSNDAMFDPPMNTDSAINDLQPASDSTTVTSEKSIEFDITTPTNKLNFDNLPITPVESQTTVSPSNQANQNNLFKSNLMKIFGNLPPKSNEDKENSGIQTHHSLVSCKSMFETNPTFTGLIRQSHLEDCSNNIYQTDMETHDVYKRKIDEAETLTKVPPEGLIKSEFDPDVFHSNSMPAFSTQPIISHQPRLRRFCSVPLVPTHPRLMKPSTQDQEDDTKGQEISSNIAIGDGSKPHALPILPHREDYLAYISPETLAKVLDGETCLRMDNTVIIDCRYPYEYEGGHIKNAINLYTKASLENYFFSSSSCFILNYQTTIKDLVLIFHCEYSKIRGPKLARHFRHKDRSIHLHCYPKLYYPEIYVVKGGYREFFRLYPNHCVPSLYVSMMDKRYLELFAKYKREEDDMFSEGPDFSSVKMN